MITRQQITKGLRTFCCQAACRTLLAELKLVFERRGRVTG